MNPEKFLLDANDWVPNNQGLPVLIYRSVESGAREQIAEAFETRFADHGWPAKWRDTIFDYHHYHSTTHEALGVASGRASLILGGPGAQIVSVAAGDALVLPVGTGHCLIEASEDFLVVGAYPEGQDWDICQDPPSKEALERIQTMLAAEQDPVTGK
ncbi:cupin [Novosphingobium sp. KA1]|uniref:cupin n=1 Tax=Novosphingobium sp. (strain KA1) TaxID=164608 RepID=UPI001A8E5768|nr:cupin [Novosphingobium sp. KA1]QSR19391.1 cupin [Novosphingobium sp. KA1]